MICTAVYYAQRIAKLRKCTCEAFDLWKAIIFEVYHSQAAQSRGSLVHQAAGFAKKPILGELSYSGDFNGAERRIAAEAVEDIAYENLIGGGRGQA